MIAKKPKKSTIALIAAALIVVIAAVICFSTTQQANVPQMSSEQQASILEAWSGQREYLNFEAPETFSSLFYKRDGIRYYGSYERGNYEDQTDQYSILFVPCLDSDSPTQLDINGAVFTHRSPFSLYIYSTLEIAGKIFPYFEPAPLMNIPQDVIDRAAQIHATYERMLYGSVLKNVTVPNDPTGLKEAESTWQAYTGRRRDMADTKNDYFLGRHDGYLTVFFHSGTRPQMVSSIQIGNRTFWCGCGFNMIGIKDGAIHDLEDLYDQGLISLESINKIADAHYAAYPGYYYIEPEETGGFSFIDKPVHTESEGWRQLTADELQQAKDFITPSASMKKADPLSDSIRRLLVSPFGSPEAIDLSTLVLSLPSAEPLTDKKELQALLKHPDLPSPTPSSFLKVSQSDVDQALNRFLGITSAQTYAFRNHELGKLLYLEDYRAFYYASSQIPGFGSFRPDYGYTNGNTAVFYHEGRNNLCYILTFRRTDGGWKIGSYQRVKFYPEPNFVNASGSVKVPTVMLGGKLYVYERIYYGNLPKTYSFAGNVAHRDDNKLPTQDLYASQVPIDSRLFTTFESDQQIFIQIANWGLSIFRLAEAD